MRGTRWPPADDAVGTVACVVYSPQGFALRFSPGLAASARSSHALVVHTRHVMNQGWVGHRFVYAAEPAAMAAMTGPREWAPPLGPDFCHPRHFAPIRRFLHRTTVIGPISHSTHGK